MSDTVTIDVHDMRVKITNPINIPIINQPNPALGVTATSAEIRALIAMPNYNVTAAGTDTPITGHNFYEYFPDEDPHGGGGGGGGGGGTGDGYTAGYAPKSKHGSAEVSPAGQRTNIESG